MLNNRIDTPAPRKKAITEDTPSTQMILKQGSHLPNNRDYETKTRDVGNCTH